MLENIYTSTLLTIRFFFLLLLVAFRVLEGKLSEPSAVQKIILIHFLNIYFQLLSHYGLDSSTACSMSVEKNKPNEVASKAFKNLTMLKSVPALIKLFLWA